MVFLIMSNRSIERDIAQIALYAALIAALGLLPKISIPLAGGIPITAQSLGVMLAGVMLGPVRGALALLLFLVVVALGMPLLAGGRGGLGVFAAPSVGFLIGWPFAAMACGLIMKLLRGIPVFPAACIAAVLGGIVVLYGFGIVGLSMKTEMSLAKAASVMVVYLPGDALKVVLTGLIAQTVWRGMPQALLSRA